MFLAKTNHFIVIIVSLIDQMVDRSIMVRTISWSVPADSHVFICDEQTRGEQKNQKTD
jgi:hypothetical protein